MSENPKPSAADLRAAFLARRIPTGDCTPVPCDDCPIPGVHVARMSAGMYLRYVDSISPFETKAGDDEEARERKAEQRLTVRLRYAAVDADGHAVFQPGDADLAEIDFDAVSGLLAQFSEVNGMVEKKAPPPNASPAESPSSSAAGTSGSS